ncbi:hypothetical protein [Chitinophaga silvisoli]|uniref:Adhesin n=1 Tax=Chitinophaga silvisoli TaxID=2291814 RepID=A0A3E1NZG8_9BACT|nr:hypothetical protein [Chitinophaga silvisoli]RFM33313.1 hypothetical protein DXN04_20020 [Chitinophaga silvisoli]
MASKTLGREELKEHFKNGKVPTETHFGYLIDSAINKQEDGFAKDEENGLLIKAMGTSSRLISFYRNTDDQAPFFMMEKDERSRPAMRMQAFTTETEEVKRDAQSFFLHMNGSMGLGAPCDENTKLQVNGFASMEGRIGNYMCGTIPADGKWHNILENLNNCQAMEVMARVGVVNTGRFAILHAIAVSTFGNGHNSINSTGAHYGFFWNKLRLRWKGSTHNYRLQLRTNSNYGKGVAIYYRITRLWDDESFLPAECYH